MGYDTRYKLECADRHIITEWLATQTGKHDEAAFALNPDGSTREWWKWYEHEKDMLTLSAAHPAILFTLSGEGEEAGDVWKKYFLGGKIQVARATFVIEDFDPEKLVRP